MGTSSRPKAWKRSGKNGNRPIFSFDDAPLEDAADLRRRIQEERPE
jgi:hypothetical protein